MSDQAKWGIGLALTLLLAVPTATWVISTSIGDVRERMATVEVQIHGLQDGIREVRDDIREMRDDLTWLRENLRAESPAGPLVEMEVDR